jgi:hypothetical protein
MKKKRRLAMCSGRCRHWGGEQTRKETLECKESGKRLEVDVHHDLEKLSERKACDQEHRGLSLNNEWQHRRPSHPKGKEAHLASTVARNGKGEHRVSHACPASSVRAVASAAQQSIRGKTTMRCYQGRKSLIIGIAKGWDISPRLLA